MIIPTWKTIGKSTHLLAKEIGLKIAQKTKNPNHKKATHTGTLDPMAEGVVIILTGNDRFKKTNFSNWKKTYQFEIMFGISTDSHDLLGLQTNLTKKYLPNLTKLNLKLNNLIPDFLGPQKQIQPIFSSQRIGGKSAFDLAKNKNYFDSKINNINIYSLKILEKHEKKLAQLKKEILEKLSHINGDFRQEEIKKAWEKTFDQLAKLGIKTLPIIKLEAEVGKRTYIRALVRDFAEKLKIPATTFSIIRTKNGKFDKDSCNYLI